MLAASGVLTVAVKGKYLSTAAWSELYVFIVLNIGITVGLRFKSYCSLYFSLCLVGL